MGMVHSVFSSGQRDLGCEERFAFVNQVSGRMQTLAPGAPGTDGERLRLAAGDADQQ